MLGLNPYRAADEKKGKIVPSIYLLMEETVRSHQPPASEKHCWAPRNVGNNITKICFIEVVLREKLTYSCMFHLICQSHRRINDDGSLVASDAADSEPTEMPQKPLKCGKNCGGIIYTLKKSG